MAEAIVMKITHLIWFPTSQLASITILVLLILKVNDELFFK